MTKASMSKAEKRKSMIRISALIVAGVMVISAVLAVILNQ